jgi:hypothetical protein
MAERLWFTAKSTRRIILRSFAVLVGKAPTKQKRIKMLVTMPLSGQKVTGYPDWLADARDYVMKNGEVIKAAQVVAYCNITMRDENLFQNTPIEAPGARLSHFSIEQMGDSEDPDTVLKFQVIAPFSTDLNRWCGQMAGEEFDSTYQVTEAPADAGEEGELELTSEDDKEEEEDDADDALAEGDNGEDEQAGQVRRRARRAPAAAPQPVAVH